jgi:MYXO-CTERM domain-containing protein
MEVDQSMVDEWYTLGEFQFDEGGDQRVELYDNTDVEGEDLHITADAIRLTRLDLPGGSDMGGDNSNPDAGDDTSPDMGGGDGGGMNGPVRPGSVFDPEDIRVNQGCCRVVSDHSPSSRWAWLALFAALFAVRRRD